MTFNSLQVLTGEHRTLEQVKSTLLRYFKTKDLVLADAETAHFSYVLALSENGKWLTVCRPEYDTEFAFMSKDRQNFMEAFQTCCIETGIVDSDMLTFNLFDYKTGSSDAIIIGGEGYGRKAETGRRELWEPLLNNGATWENLQEILCEEYASGEKVLWKISPLFGMDRNIATQEYSALDSMEYSNPNIEMLYLKSTKSKPKGLGTVFKKVFGEALAPLGFVKIKGRQPYFVRVVPGGEIIHVITYMEERSSLNNYKEFDILGGVATVYRKSIDLTLSPKWNSNWLRSSCWIYPHSNPSDYDPDFRNSIYRFSCGKDEESMVKGVEYSLEVTKNIMLPVLDKITDLNSCIENHYIIGMDMHLYDDDDFGNKYGNSYYNEGLLLIKTDNQELKKKWEKILEEKVIDNTSLQKVARLYKFFSDPERHTKTLVELERRKTANTEVLRSYGLNL